jgi:hypothetical protein
MKIIKAAAAVLFLSLSCAGCDKEVEVGDPKDFVVDIQALQLVKEIGTVYNRTVALSDLKFDKIPKFATRDTVKWSSSNASAATINPETGEITITVTNPNAPEVTTNIRVESEYDPSVYAECALTVYPMYNMPRTWTFTTVSADGAAVQPSTGTTAGGWTTRTSVGDLGQGAVIMGTNGAASEYNGTGPGVYTIDPEYPYAYGVVLSGASREWSYIRPGSQVPTTFTSGSAIIPNSNSCMIRPASMARFIKINALFGPFKIEVNYAGNNNDGSHVDIRIGDTEGIRIEGADSMSNTDGKTVSYTFEESEFIPAVYLETNSGVRIWGISITTP